VGKNKNKFRIFQKNQQFLKKSRDRKKRLCKKSKKIKKKFFFTQKDFIFLITI